MFVRPGQRQNDDPVFFTLVAIYSIDLNERLKILIPLHFLELLAEDAFLFSIHANHADSRLPVLNGGFQVQQQIQIPRYFFEQFDDQVRLTSVVNAHTFVTLVVRLILQAGCVKPGYRRFKRLR